MALGTEEYEAQAGNAAALANKVQRRWNAVAPVSDSGYWRSVAEVASDIADDTADAQVESASIAASAFGKQLAKQGMEDEGGFFNPFAYVSPTEMLLDLAINAGMAEKFMQRIGKGSSEGRALALDRLLKGATTRAQDAGRTATTVKSMDQGITRYVRTLRLPSCSHCAVLAGKTFHIATAFLRHPECDCTNTPIGDISNVSEELLDVSAALESGQVGHMQRRANGEWYFRNDLNRAEMAAIKAGADPSQIINAQKGLQRVDLFGHDLKTTTFSTTKRGIKAEFRDKGWLKPGRYQRTVIPRLTPDQIWRTANGNQLEVQNLLRYYGYLPENADMKLSFAKSDMPVAAMQVEKKYTSAKAARAARRRLGDDYQHMQLEDGSWVVRPKDVVEISPIKTETPLTSTGPSSVDGWDPGVVHGVAQIDRVMDLPAGVGSKLKVEAMAANDPQLGLTEGYFSPSKKTVFMDPKLKAEDMAFVTVHELGHMFDFVGEMKGPGRLSAATHPDVAELFQQLRAQDSYKKALQDATSAQSKYLALDSELWARAYSQWVATKTQDPMLLNGLRGKRAWHWTDEEFAGIMPLMDRVIGPLAKSEVSSSTLRKMGVSTPALKPVKKTIAPLPDSPEILRPKPAAVDEAAYILEMADQDGFDPGFRLEGNAIHIYHRQKFEEEVRAQINIWESNLDPSMKYLGADFRRDARRRLKALESLLDTPTGEKVYATATAARSARRRAGDGYEVVKLPDGSYVVRVKAR